MERGSRRRTSGEDEEDEKEGDDKLVMAWDTPKVMLPEGPRERWTRASRAEVKLPLASKLEVVPEYKGLPTKAPVNNMHGEAKRWADKHRGGGGVQQTIPHLLRLPTASAQDDQQGELRYSKAW